MPAATKRVSLAEMKTDDRRLAREHLTMTRMIEIYCGDKHESPAGELCTSCRDFLDYAERRLEKCPYGGDKPTCANCPVHCYKHERREEARRIMRYAGPRMLLRHPLLTVAHKFDGLRKAIHPRELTREERLRSRKD